MSSHDAEKIAKAINAKYGNVVFLANQIKPLPRVKTDLYSMDFALNGGMPLGVPILLSGKKSTAKSAFCYYMMGKTYEQYGGIPILIQTEPGFDEEWAFKCGMPFDTVFFDGSQYSVIENLQFILDTIRDCKPKAIVVDSLSAMVSELDKTLMESKSHGSKAKIINDFFRRLTGCIDKENPPLVIIIEHLHPDMSPGTMGNRMITMGGETKGYIAVIEMRFRIDAIIKEIIDEIVLPDGKNPQWIVQKRICWELHKSKVGNEGAVGTFTISIRDSKLGKMGEISDFDELVQRAIYYGIIRKSGNWYILGEDKFNGIANLKEGVSTKTLRELIEQEVERRLEQHKPKTEEESSENAVEEGGGESSKRTRGKKSKRVREQEVQAGGRGNEELSDRAKNDDETVDNYKEGVVTEDNK